MLLARAFSQGALGKILTVEKVSQAEGRRRLDRGEASALIDHPRGLTQAFVQSGSQLRSTWSEIRRSASFPTSLKRRWPSSLDRAASLPERTPSGNSANRHRDPGQNGTARRIRGHPVARRALHGNFLLGRGAGRGRLARTKFGRAAKSRHYACEVRRVSGGKLLAAALVFAAIGAFGLLAAQRLDGSADREFSRGRSVDRRVWLRPVSADHAACNRRRRRSAWRVADELRDTAAGDAGRRIRAIRMDAATAWRSIGRMDAERMVRHSAARPSWLARFQPATIAGIAVFLAVAWLIDLRTIRRAAC